MTKDEALRLALEALEAKDGWGSSIREAKERAITAIKAALEAKGQPVAWYDSVSGWTDFHSFKPTRKPSSPSAEWLPLYATPPHRKPLTDEQIWDAYMKAPVDIDCHVSDLHKFARAIESAHCITGDNND